MAVTHKKIRDGFLLPSAAYTVARKSIRGIVQADKKPEVGDLVYGSVSYIGQHVSLENKQGRIHAINNGTRAIFATRCRSTLAGACRGTQLQNLKRDRVETRNVQWAPSTRLGSNRGDASPASMS